LQLPPEGVDQSIAVAAEERRDVGQAEPEAPQGDYPIQALDINSRVPAMPAGYRSCGTTRPMWS